MVATADNGTEKRQVRQFWDDVPCGTGGIDYPEGTRQYFDEVAANRDRLEPFIASYAEFDRWGGRQVLEIGCGAGSDLLRFAQAGARVVGLDLSSHSAALAKRRLAVYGCGGETVNSDAENLPLKTGTVDLVYSWGVLHHTPQPEHAIREIYRVLKPGGRICIMLYNRHSLVALQMYLMFGLFRLRPFLSLKDILAKHHESPGTKAYTLGEVRRMFSDFQELDVRAQFTCYDLRYGRDRYLPGWLGRLVPRRFGWFIVIRGKKG